MGHPLQTLLLNGLSKGFLSTISILSGAFVYFFFDKATRGQIDYMAANLLALRYQQKHYKFKGVCRLPGDLSMISILR